MLHGSCSETICSDASYLSSLCSFTLLSSRLCLCLLSIQAARSFGCEVDTLTLSVQQKALAEERIKEAGLEGRVRVHLMDYRELPPEFEKAFDAFVSVEMIEVSINIPINPPGSCVFKNRILIYVFLFLFGNELYSMWGRRYFAFSIPHSAYCQY